MDRFFELIYEARSAFNFGELEVARVAAEELLNDFETKRDDDLYGQGLHVAHVVLGQLAVRDGDLKSAKSHLESAGKVPDSDELCYKGPDLCLAADLIKLNQKAIVKKFLQRVERFWRYPEAPPEIDAWIQKVSRGEIDYDLLW